MTSMTGTRTTERRHFTLNRFRLSHITQRVLLYASLIVVGVVWAIPFVWIVVSSLKVEKNILTYPVRWIPDPFTLENYREVLDRFPIDQWLLNSFIVSFSTVLLSLIAVCLGAYALARMEFRGRKFVYMLILASFLLPTDVTLVPLFLGFSKLKVLDSYFSLISVGIADAFNLFLLTQFFQTFPKELEDAARIDGCSRLGVLRHMLLPLSKPALVTAALFSFFTSWNNFTWPLIAVDSDAHRTLPVGIATFIAAAEGWATFYGVIMAGAVIACIPGLIAFFLLQQYFVQGIATTGIKS